MGRRSGGGGISFTSIIFMIIAYNIFFGSDDSDDKKVKVEVTDAPEVSERIDIDTEKIKEGIDILIKNAKKVGSDIKVLVVEEFEKNKEDDLKEDESGETSIKPKEDKPKETAIATQTPKEDKPKETGMKKL